MSYVSKVMQSSSNELLQLAHSEDAEAFSKSAFAGSSKILLSTGGMVVRKSPDGMGFAIFSDSCTGIAEVQPSSRAARVARCSACRAREDSCKRQIWRVHQPIMPEFGQCIRIDIIANDPRKAEQEIQGL